MRKNNENGYKSDSHDFGECEKELIRFLTMSADVEVKGGEYSYTNILTKFKDAGFTCEECQNGVLVPSANILITKNKSLCEQQYNSIPTYKNVVYFDDGEIEGYIGMYYIFNGKPTFPISEHLAQLTTCEKCKKMFVYDYFISRNPLCLSCIQRGNDAT